VRITDSKDHEVSYCIRSNTRREMSSSARKRVESRLTSKNRLIVERGSSPVRG